MDQKKIIESLRTEAGTNKLAAAVFHLFAMRERSRRRITIRSLSLKMKAEGFIYNKQEYTPLFQFLSRLDLGSLERNRRGGIKALRDIPVTLKSIGLAAVGKSNGLIQFRSKAKQAKPQAAFRPGLTVRPPSNTDIKIMVTINERPWYLDVPKDYTEQDIAKIISLLNKN